MRRATFVALLAIGCASAAFAQTATEPTAATVAPVVASDVAAPPPETRPTAIHLPAGAEVQVELLDRLSSRTSHIGDTFNLRLRRPIIIDGRELVPAGATGGGEVIDAVPSGFGGRQGRLIVSARYLDLNGQRVRIRGMQLTAFGEDRANEALAVSMIPYLGIASLFMTGGNIELPPGAHGTARIAAETDLPLTAPAATAEPVAATPEETAAPATAPSTPTSEVNQGGSQP